MPAPGFLPGIDVAGSTLTGGPTDQGSDTFASSFGDFYAAGNPNASGGLQVGWPALVVVGLVVVVGVAGLIYSRGR